MLIAFGVALAVVVVLLVSRRTPWTNDTAHLGSVSERWLAEYRASHPF